MPKKKVRKHSICNSGHDHCYKDGHCYKGALFEICSVFVRPNVATNLLQTGFAPFTFSPNGWIPYLGPFIGRVLCIIYTRTDWYNKQGKRFALDIGLLGSCLSLTPSLIFHTCTSILAVCSSLSFQLFSIHVLAL